MKEIIFSDFASHLVLTTGTSAEYYQEIYELLTYIYLWTKKEWQMKTSQKQMDQYLK